MDKELETMLLSSESNNSRSLMRGNWDHTSSDQGLLCLEFTPGAAQGDSGIEPGLASTLPTALSLWLLDLLVFLKVYEIKISFKMYN